MRSEQDDGDDEGYGEASRYTAHLDRGWSLLDRGDLQQARNSAHQAMKLRPEVPDGAMLMAAISMAESDPEAGLEWYERAIEADSDYVDAQLAAAQILLYDLDEPARALARAEQARELDEATLADQIDLGLLEIEALIGLHDVEGARERLTGLSELWVLERLLSAETPQAELRQALEDFVGQPFDPDEDGEHLVHRAVQMALRVARLYIDLGGPEAALPWLERLLRGFGEDPDIWYLANEAAYLAGDMVKAALAAMQVVQLDANAEPPSWAPTSSQLHAQVVEILQRCADEALRQLVTEPGFIILVPELPAYELVLEGVDPRVRALALASRSSRDPDAAPSLTGVAVYRRNLLRMVRDPALLDRELELALLDELAVFFAYDDAQRERLGLPPNDLEHEARSARTHRALDEARGREPNERASEPEPEPAPEPPSPTAEPSAAAPTPEPASNKPSKARKRSPSKATSKKPSKKPASKRASKAKSKAKATKAKTAKAKTTKTKTTKTKSSRKRAGDESDS